MLQFFKSNVQSYPNCEIRLNFKTRSKSGNPDNTLVQASEGFDIYANKITIKGFSIKGTGTSDAIIISDWMSNCRIENNKLSDHQNGVDIGLAFGNIIYIGLTQLNEKPIAWNLQLSKIQIWPHRLLHFILYFKCVSPNIIIKLQTAGKESGLQTVEILLWMTIISHNVIMDLQCLIHHLIRLKITQLQEII